jgi:predicted nucleic acid-binding protein
MATYVVDASIVVQYAIEQDQTAAVRNLIARMYRGNEELIIPEFCLLECTNVIWKEVRFVISQKVLMAPELQLGL